MKRWEPKRGGERKGRGRRGEVGRGKKGGGAGRAGRNCPACPGRRRAASGALRPPVHLPGQALPGRGARGSYLGACHADLRPCVDVDAAVGLSRDGAAHGVGDAHGQGSAVLAVAQCQEGVRGLACRTGDLSAPRSASLSPTPNPLLLHLGSDTEIGA